MSQNVREEILPHRIKAKVFFSAPVDLEEITLVFNRWIREQRLDGHLLIDIADYRHVPGGPGVILVGHEADIAIDLGDGRPGLAYIRKRSWPDADRPDGDPLRLRIRTVLGWLVRVAAELELPTDGSEIRIWFQDRLFLRQRDQRPALVEAVRLELGLLGREGLDVSALEADPRRAVGLSARFWGDGGSAAQLLPLLAAPPPEDQRPAPDQD